MAQVILKKSSVAARVPTTADLAFGELALNYADGLLYYKKSDGTTIASIGGTPAVRSNTITSGATITPVAGSSDQFTVTALAVAATIAAPSGTPTDGQKLTLRIKDNGTAQTLTWTTTSGGYRIIGTTLPATTIATKTMYVGCIYNTTDAYWDVVSVAQQA